MKIQIQDLKAEKQSLTIGLLALSRLLRLRVFLRWLPRGDRVDCEHNWAIASFEQ